MIKQRTDKLTKVEELALGERIQKMKGLIDTARDDFNEEELKLIEEGNDALEDLISNYYNFARKIAYTHHRRTGTRYSSEDLEQDAILSLVDAALDYDPAKNCTLGTFAYYRMAKMVSSTINYQRLVRMPENKMGNYITITNAQKEYNKLSEEEQKKYKNELAYVYKNVGNIKKENVDIILGNMQPQVSLNAPIFEGAGELMDILVDPTAHEEIERIDTLDTRLVRLMSRLDSFEQDLIAYEYKVIEPSMKYEDFIKEHNLTPSKVKYETAKIIKRLKRMANTNNMNETSFLN